MTAAVMENSPSENSSIKTVTEERIDESGRRVRITRKIRMRLVTEEVSPEVAARRVTRLHYRILFAIELEEVWCFCQ